MTGGSSRTRGKGKPTAPRIVALADDLTGANALAAMLAERGYRAVSTLRLPAHETADALVVDTATRDLSGAAAAKRVTAAMRQLGALPSGTLLTKRIDSTLRGQVMVEVAAMLAALPAETVAVVVAAVPGAGRAVVNGILRVPSGVEGGGTDVTLLAREAFPAGAVAIPLAMLREQMQRVSERMGGSGARMIVADAETGGDIERLAEAAVACGRPVLPVDPGGFTTALARRYAPPPHRVLAVLGTPAMTSTVQRMHAAKALTARTHTLGGTAMEAEVLACEDAVCLISIAEGAFARAAKALPRLTGAVLARGDVRGLFVSGGETARRVLRGLGARGVTIQAEVEPLVAYGRLAGGRWHGLPLVTKGGMVGDAEALRRCLELLQGGTTDHG